MEVNLLPFMRLRILMSSFAPLYSEKRKLETTVPELVAQMFDSKNQMLDCDNRHGVYLTAIAMFRGKVSTS